MNRLVRTRIFFPSVSSDNPTLGALKARVVRTDGDKKWSAIVFERKSKGSCADSKSIERVFHQQSYRYENLALSRGHELRKYLGRDDFLIFVPNFTVLAGISEVLFEDYVFVRIIFKGFLSKKVAGNFTFDGKDCLFCLVSFYMCFFIKSVYSYISPLRGPPLVLHQQVP